MLGNSHSQIQRMSFVNISVNSSFYLENLFVRQCLSKPFSLNTLYTKSIYAIESAVHILYITRQLIVNTSDVIILQESHNGLLFLLGALL